MTNQRPQIATFALRRLQPMDREGRPRQGSQRLAALLIVAALVGVVLAGVLATYVIFASQTGTASLAAQHFCDALTQQDYATAYADLAQPLQREGTEPQFADSQSEIDRLSGPATSCTFITAQVSGKSATFTLKVARSKTLRGALHMALEHGAWKISAYDSNVI